MTARTILAGAAAALGLTTALTTALPALAADGAVKVGLIYTLSGPSAALGEQARNGFQLAVDTMGGSLGGDKVEVVVADDEQKPDVAVNKVKELLERDKVDVVVGPIFSNVLMAIEKPVVDAGKILVSTNAGASSLAGKDCNPLFFVTSYQNDDIHQTAGEYAHKQGFKNVFLMAPNYQAGKDAINGFKRSYKGNVAGEVYTQLGQLDFSAELAQIAAFQPDAIFTFMPGGMGVNLVKQYRQAGLDKVPLLSAFTVDESTLPAQQDAAVDLLSATNWTPDLDAPGNKEFVAAYEAKYGAVPGTYAMQAYDAALLLDAALKATGGNAADSKALAKAMETATFPSLRGKFKFGPNHYPIQDLYIAKAVKREDGKFATSMVEKVFTDHQDSYAKDCQMPAN